ncbi:MAG: DUF4815 domain-containing protein [Tepidamorphaceae bacterium]
MAFEHSSGLPATFDRTAAKPTHARAFWPEGVFVQGSDLNDAFSMMERRGRRVGGLVARDGDRSNGSAIYVAADPEPATTFTVNLEQGTVYIEGDVLPVAAAEFANFDLAGDVRIGVRLQRGVITHEDDTDLLGLQPGTLGFEQPGAAREADVLVWAIEGDAQEGAFYPVYLLRDGTVIDQTPPPDLTGIQNVLAGYDFDANCNYKVGAKSCNVTALGKFGDEHVFSIAPGTANILGQKRTRKMTLRHAVTEAPDLEAISAEPHTYTAVDGDPTVVTVSRPPIAAISSVVIVKRTTETVLRGPIPGGSDDLQHSSVVEIESITGYTDGDDYDLAGDAVSWAARRCGAGGRRDLRGHLPLQRCRRAAGADGYAVHRFRWRQRPPDPRLLHEQAAAHRPALPRCRRPAGLRDRRFAAKEPVAAANAGQRLKLCEVSNDWLGTPAITNNGTRAYINDDIALLRSARAHGRAVRPRRAAPHDHRVRSGCESRHLH